VIKWWHVNWEEYNKQNLEGKSLSDIAKEIGCSNSSVRRNFIRLEFSYKTWSGRIPGPVKILYVKNNNGCHLCTSHKPNNKGYVRFGPKRRYLHRIMYERFKGPIPKGMCVLHTCDVRSCINPGHLYLGTNDDNVADRDSRGRQRNASTGKLCELKPGISDPSLLEGNTVSMILEVSGE